MTEVLKVRLTDLLVNKENYRFEELSSQKDAIDHMVENQKDGLVNLADHILQHGLNPNDRIQLYPSEENIGKYIVLEGNRRTVCLKLLSNPELIDNPDFEHIKKRFRRLHERFVENPIDGVEAVVYHDPNEADIWIGVKHGYGKSGVSTDSWDPIAKARFGRKIEGKTSRVLQVIERMKSSEYVDPELKKSIDTLNTTNLDRLLGDPYAREKLGIDIDNGKVVSRFDEKQVIEALSKIVKDILSPSFKVEKIYNKEARKTYIDSFEKKSLPDPKSKQEGVWTFEPLPTTPQAPKEKAKPRLKALPTERKNLIPKSCVIAISNSKANQIYHELQTLDVTVYTNAAAVLFRVFVELSIDTYLEKKGLIDNKASAAKSGIDFQQKVFRVIDNLKKLKVVDDAITKQMRTNIKNSNDLLGLDTWHAYIHNNRFIPISTNLIATWDGVQDFMTALWNVVETVEK